MRNPTLSSAAEARRTEKECPVPVGNVYGVSGYWQYGPLPLAGKGRENNWDIGGFPGTSTATPQIAALAAILYGQNPSRTPADVMSIIKERTKGPDKFNFIRFEVDQAKRKIAAVADFEKAVTGLSDFMVKPCDE